MLFGADKKRQPGEILPIFGQGTLSFQSIGLRYWLYYLHDTGMETKVSCGLVIGILLAVGMACSGTTKYLKEI